jgi:hypothetical protein
VKISVFFFFDSVGSDLEWFLFKYNLQFLYYVLDRLCVCNASSSSSSKCNTFVDLVVMFYLLHQSILPELIQYLAFYSILTFLPKFFLF